MSGRVLNHWVLQSVFVLLASLCLLAGAVLWGRDRSGLGQPVVVSGAELRPGAPFAQATDAGLIVHDVPAGGRATALASGFRLQGEDYASAIVELGGYRPGDQLLFLWSEAAAPDAVLGTPLSWSGGETLAARLEAQPPWGRTLTALGVGVAGPLAAPLTIRRLRLVPRTRAAVAASVWREWAAFEGLDAHSSNFVIGGSDQVRPPFRPAPAAAAWVGLSLALHFLVRASGRRWPDPRVCASVVLAGWVLLDARWQVDLWRQLRFTRERYAGKPWLEKRLAAEDGDLFRFALDLKARLPPSPQVVYLLARDPDVADRYLQLRARYHLLPHNVCIYYSAPPAELAPGEYLVVFASRTDLVYDAAAGTLRSETEEVPVERILAGRLGTLYRRR